MRALRVARLALLLALLWAGRAVAQSPAAPAMSDEVRGHWERGLAEYGAHRYQAASAEFAACHRIAQRRECLFAWAQAARLGGDCETAAALYRRYLMADLSPRQIEAAGSQLAACEAERAARVANRGRSDEPRTTPATARPVSPSIEQSGAGHAVDREAPPDAPWYRDGWGDALVGAGVTGLAAGTWLYVAARGDAAATAPSYGAYEEQFRRAERTRTWSFIVLGAGTAMIAAGVAHMLQDAAPSSAPPHVGLAIGAAELAIHYTGRF